MDMVSQENLSLVLLLLVALICICIMIAMYCAVLLYVRMRKQMLRGLRIQVYNYRRLLVFYEVIAISWIPVIIGVLLFYFGNGKYNDLLSFYCKLMSIIVIAYNIYLICSFFRKKEYMRKRISV